MKRMEGEMGLIEDARELANSSIETLTVTGNMVCAVCFYSGHKKSGCPVLSLPRIVAALEAAQAAVERGIVVSDTRGFGSCVGCTAYYVDDEGPKSHRDATFRDHAPDCPARALVAAMQEG